MAGRDYIHCAKCGERMIYDGSDAVRDGLEYRYGKPDAQDWTVDLTCPKCSAALTARHEEVCAELDKARGLLACCASSLIKDRRPHVLKRVRDFLAREVKP